MPVDGAVGGELDNHLDANAVVAGCDLLYGYAAAAGDDLFGADLLHQGVQIEVLNRFGRSSRERPKRMLLCHW